MYGGFPPPICGESLSNKVLSKFLVNEGYKINKYNTVVDLDFNEIGKISFKKIIHGLKLIYNFYRNSKEVNVVYSTMSQSKFGFFKFYPVYKICQLKKIPYIVHLKGNMLPETFRNSNFIIKTLILDVLNNSKKIIVLSELLKNQEPYQISSTDVKIVKNFAEEKYFVSYKKKIEIINRIPPIKLFYLSNLMESKGVLDVLKAALLLKKEKVIFKLKLAGLWQKKIKKQGEKMIKELGEDYVNYLDVVIDKEKKQLIQESHIFILPTYYPQEGQPISILEAMAGGNVVITTKHSGIPDIVKEGINGFFVNKKDPYSILKILLYLFKNKQVIRKISKNNINEARKKYTVDIFGKKIERIITKIGKDDYR